MEISVNVSAGELLDKVSILEIKKDKIPDKKKVKEVEKELGILKKVCESKLRGYERWVEEIKHINEMLWEYIGLQWDDESGDASNEEKLDSAKAVLVTNDLRFKIKDEINKFYDSDINEQKSYGGGSGNLKESFIAKNKIKKILVIKNDHLGDYIVCSGFIRELSKQFPKAEITLIASNAGKRLAEKDKRISKIIVQDYVNLKKLPKNPKKLLDFYKLSKKIGKEKFDIGFDLRGNFSNTYFLLYKGKVKYKVGFYKDLASKTLLDYAYKRSQKVHEGITMIDLLNKSLNLNLSNFWPEIVTDKDNEKAVEGFLKENKIKKFVCIMPEGTHPKKRWGFENWNSIIKFLQKDYNEYKILLMGMETDKLLRFVKLNPGIIIPPDSVNKNLQGMYLLLKKSSLTISPDGGAMHLVWMGKSKLIALIPAFLSIYHSGPLGENSRTIWKPMKKIGVEEVKKLIEGFLGKGKGLKSSKS